ncbi:hypothetical protein LTS17_005164 [Exophiala oligosperma]
MGSIAVEYEDPRPPLGVISSEMNICRLPGDPNNMRTFDFPVIEARTKGALLVRMVSEREYSPEVLDNFVAAGQELIDRGAVGLITSCGFLAMAQKELSRRLSVPVAASSLLQIPLIRTTLRYGQGIGILTFDRLRLNHRHLAAVGITDISGLYISGPPPEGRMKGCLRDGLPYNVDALTEELIKVAMDLVSDHNDIGAILLECTQFPPFADAIQRVTGLPVYDVTTLANWFYAGLVRKPFAPLTATEKADTLIKRPRTEEELLENEVKTT